MEVMTSQLALATAYLGNSFDPIPTAVTFALNHLGVERKADTDNLTCEERMGLRNRLSLPILTVLEKWLLKESCKVLTKSPIGKAIKILVYTAQPLLLAQSYYSFWFSQKKRFTLHSNSRNDSHDATKK